MNRLKLLYLTFGVVIGAVAGVIITVAVARSGFSDSGSVPITEQEHDHSAHGAGTQDDSDDSGHHERQAGMREEDTAGMNQETNAGMTEHHDDQDNSSDSTIHADHPEPHSQEGHHADRNHRH